MFWKLVGGWWGGREGDEELAWVLGLICEQVQGGWGGCPIQILHLLLNLVSVGILHGMQQSQNRGKSPLPCTSTAHTYAPAQYHEAV